MKSVLDIGLVILAIHLPQPLDFIFAIFYSYIIAIFYYEYRQI